MASCPYLSLIHILFFVGVNDGSVPKAGSTGNIISQFEREKMAEHHLMLAPGAREKVFIQKFYLYLNLTKPSDGLYVTYSRVSPEGKALRRSYLIGTLCNMFPELKIREPEEETAVSYTHLDVYKSQIMWRSCMSCRGASRTSLRGRS